MLRHVFLLALLALSQGHVIQERATKLNFGFYITSRCRDTINFVTTQLNSAYGELNEYFNVEFVPWGKTRRNPDGSLTCQFGPTDCDANRIQSCVLNLIGDDQAKQMEYINCEMTNLSAVDQNYQCAIDVGIAESEARACFDSALGDELQAQAEAKTNNITMIFVPTIVKDRVYDVDVQDAAFANFKGYVCSLLVEENPPACSTV
jgi:interferon, gamma-inducible protein 30